MKQKNRLPPMWGQHVALGDPFLTPNCILDIAGADFIVPESPDGDVPPGSRLMPDRTGSWPAAEAPDGSSVDLTAFPPKSDRLVDYLSFNNLVDGWYAVTNPDRGVGFGLRWGQRRISLPLVLASVRRPQRVSVVQAHLQRRIGAVHKSPERNGGTRKR